MDASEHLLHYKIKEGANSDTGRKSAKLDALSQTKEKAKLIYQEAILNFNNHVKNDYIQVSGSKIAYFYNLCGLKFN